MRRGEQQLILDGFRIRVPVPGDERTLGKCDQREFVPGIGARQHRIQSGAHSGNVVVHAAADIEDHGERKRHFLLGEIGDPLLHLVLINVKSIASDPANRPLVAVEDRSVD